LEGEKQLVPMFFTNSNSVSRENLSIITTTYHVYGAFSPPLKVCVSSQTGKHFFGDEVQNERKQ